MSLQCAYLHGVYDNGKTAVASNCSTSGSRFCLPISGGSAEHFYDSRQAIWFAGSPVEREASSQVRIKLQAFLKQSNRYDANSVLAHVLDSSLWEEQVILHSKVSSHFIRDYQVKDALLTTAKCQAVVTHPADAHASTGLHCIPILFSEPPCCLKAEAGCTGLKPKYHQHTLHAGQVITASVYCPQFV